MTAIHHTAARALAALDFAAENSALAALAEEGEHLSGAMRKAEARIAEVNGQISTFLQERMAAKSTAVAVADALLGESDASKAIASLVNERDLRNELSALRAGLRELQDRSRDNGEAMARVKGEALGKVVPALQPVVDAMIEDARAAAVTIGQAFATVAAISGATRHFEYEARQLGECLARLMSGSLIARRDVIATPDAVAEMLEPLADKGAAALGNVPAFAGVPDDRSAMSGIVGGMAGAAALQAVG